MLELEYEGPGIPYSEVWIVSKKKKNMMESLWSSHQEDDIIRCKFQQGHSGGRVEDVLLWENTSDRVRKFISSQKIISAVQMREANVEAKSYLLMENQQVESKA